MCQKKIFEYVFLSIVWVLLSIIVMSSVHATVIPAATVLSAGSDTWVKRVGEHMPLQQKAPVFKGDIIITNGIGRGQIVFADNPIAAICTNTQILISEISFSVLSSSKFKADESRGVVHLFTGKIVKRNREIFSFDLPVSGKTRQPTDWFSTASNCSFFAAASSDIGDLAVDSTNMTNLGNIRMMKEQNSTDDQ